MKPDKLGLVVERIDMRERTRTENHEHILRLRREVRLPRGIGLGGVDGRADRRLGPEQPLLVQEGSERYARQASAAQLQKGPAVKHPAAGGGEEVIHVVLSWWLGVSRR